MAANIFNPDDYRSIVGRLTKLNASSAAQWGKMNLPQMLEHCAIQLKMALGIVPAVPAGSAIYRTSVGRWLALYVMPWPKGSATPPTMNMATNHAVVQDFTTAKEQLLQLLVQVQQTDSLRPHPFFGAMNQQDWGRLIWKHLNHHLRQFGA